MVFDSRCLTCQDIGQENLPPIDDTHLHIYDAGALHRKSKPEMEMPKPQQYVEERMPGGKYYDDGEAWREMPHWEVSAQSLSVDASKRWYDGVQSHGGRFLGQPTAHLREELIDAIRYAEMTEKQIAWLTAENERLVAILASKQSTSV